MERYLKNALRSSKFSGVDEKRARIMAAIRGKGNRTTELALRMAMVRCGIAGWTMHRTDVPGKPDFYFEKLRLAVFVDGCFWHGCPSCCHVPKTRRNYWKAKFERNQARDHATGMLLKREGIRILRIWEHALKSNSERTAAAKKVARVLKQNQQKSFLKSR